MKKGLFGILVMLICITILAVSCRPAASIQRYSETVSSFNNISRVQIYGAYPERDIYVIYARGKSGFTSIDGLRSSLQNQIGKFASKQKRRFVFLNEQTSKPPYIFGNYPRIEIVFALTEHI